MTKKTILSLYEYLLMACSSDHQKSNPEPTSTNLDFLTTNLFALICSKLIFVWELKQTKKCWYDRLFLSNKTICRFLKISNLIFMKQNQNSKFQHWLLNKLLNSWIINKHNEIHIINKMKKRHKCSFEFLKRYSIYRQWREYRAQNIFLK